MPPKKNKPRRAKKGFRKKASAADKKLCFVIMPFGGWFDKYYNEIFIYAIESAGLEAFRADDIFRPGNIVDDIWNYTKRAHIILADLSGKNPNVFYELGLAHALAKPAVLVTESMDHVPFDLKGLRVLHYEKSDPNWGAILSEKIENALTEVMNSPTDAVPPAFLKVEDIPQRKEVTTHDKQYLEPRNRIDQLSANVRRKRRDILPPSDAEELISSYFKKGLSRSFIIMRLVAEGVPESWVERKIDEIQSRNIASVVTSKSIPIRSTRRMTKVSTTQKRKSKKPKRTIKKRTRIKGK